MSSNFDLDYAILEEMIKLKEPLGAVNLAITIGEEYGVSQATIGRRLLYLDRKGYVQKVKNFGRVITKKGVDYFSHLDSTMVFENAKEEFIKSIEPTNLSNLIDVLIARRGLEKEAAFLAAQRATKEDIEQMEKTLATQRQKLQKKASVDREDKEFHMLMAKASKNIILQKAISLLREQNHLTRHFASVRKIAGGTLYHDHVDILEKIKNKDAQGASKCIETHMNNMIQEIENFIIKN